MTTRHTVELPTYVPYSLHLHMIAGTSYTAAKQLIESYGATVLAQDRIWEQLSILHIHIPDSENLDEWITKLHSELAIERITKVPSRLPA